MLLIFILNYTIVVVYGEVSLFILLVGYRPGVYFGMKTKSFEPTQFSLLWYNTKNFLDQIRFKCESSEGIFKTWKKHDGESFGIQEIHDSQSNLILTTEFVKVQKGTKGGDWSVRIKGTSKTNQVEEISIFFLMKDENFIQVENSKSNGMNSPIFISGNNEDLGKFMFFVKDTSEYKGESFTKLEMWLEKFHFVGRKEEFQKEKLFSHFRKFKGTEKTHDIFTLSNSVEEKSKFIVLQKILKTPFQFEAGLLSNELHSNMKKDINLLTEKKLTDL